MSLWKRSVEVHFAVSAIDQDGVHRDEMVGVPVGEQLWHLVVLPRFGVWVLPYEIRQQRPTAEAGRGIDLLLLDDWRLFSEIDEDVIVLEAPLCAKKTLVEHSIHFSVLMCHSPVGTLLILFSTTLFVTGTYHTTPWRWSTTTTTVAPTPEPGWERFGQYSYYYNDDKLQWIHAKLWCLSKGADLVSLHSYEENEFVFALSDTATWIGGYSPYRNTTFIWADGSPWNYTYWQGSKPQNDGNSNCMIYYSYYMKSYSWDTSACESTAPFVCKKKAL
ncbi:hypothetical protein QR680_004487 [Steinernema hermaphroditum]|uniref:C-type lectin domain-containing protein n=1 Tax=Steinernema hermaphroditum TaxID=289476 RepID=A0AA39HPX5_9BILA|nr:hypothetical protein QR680_004487 [Steinernema hermaphroditum]